MPDQEISRLPARDRMKRRIRRLRANNDLTATPNSCLSISEVFIY